MNRREWLRYRQFAWSDRVWDRWETRIPYWALSVLDLDWARPAICLLGHDVTMDHCMIPDHDYCPGCGKRFPGMAKERMK